jgi:glycosyltransferase involved in cell wall biosynthesis
MPKISIVLPNYNYARYLDERIQSLLNQTYQDFELIIVDDASTDNSLETIDKYTADPRVKTIFYPNNSGSVYQRWNDGAEIATGEYLMFAGADDSCHPTLLEKLTEQLDKHPSVGLAYAQSWCTDSTGKITHSAKYWTDDLSKERWLNDFVDDGKKACQYLLFKCLIPNASAVLMRRSIFIEAGKFDLQLRFAADWMLYVKMLMISDIAYLAEPLNYFRTHVNSVTKTMKSSLVLEERLQVIHYIYRRVDILESFWDTAFDPTVFGWIRAIAYREIPLSSSQKIYRSLKELDPNINYRILTRLMDAVKRKILRSK